MSRIMAQVPLCLTGQSLHPQMRVCQNRNFYPMGCLPFYDSHPWKHKTRQRTQTNLVLARSHQAFLARSFRENFFCLNPLHPVANLFSNSAQNWEEKEPGRVSRHIGKDTQGSPEVCFLFQNTAWRENEPSLPKHWEKHSLWTDRTAEITRN